MVADIFSKVKRKRESLLHISSPTSVTNIKINVYQNLNKCQTKQQYCSALCYWTSWCILIWQLRLLRCWQAWSCYSTSRQNQKSKKWWKNFRCNHPILAPSSFVWWSEGTSWQGLSWFVNISLSASQGVLWFYGS